MVGEHTYIGTFLYGKNLYRRKKIFRKYTKWYIEIMKEKGRKKMNSAYLITAYVEPEMLASLVRSLQTENTDFYIHVDKKVKIDPFLKAICKCKCDCGCITFLKEKERINVCWGGYTQVTAQYRLMKKMMDSNRKYDWVINLTGQDYPVWSNYKIQIFLQNQLAPVIKGYDLSLLQDERQQRMLKKFWFFDIYPTILRRIVNKCAITMQDVFHIERDYRSYGYCFCHGGEYWALPYQIAIKVLAYYENNKQLQKFLHTVYAPSEFWVHTVLLSSDILTDSEKERMIVSKDKYKGLIEVAPLHYFVYEEAIKILTEKDFENIKNSGKMFVRKVKIGISEQLITRLDKERNCKH